MAAESTFASTSQASNAARSVGRVGALAVALGLGVAVAALPAVAYATAEIAAASQLDWNVANCQSLVDHSTVFQPNETKSCTAVVKVKQAASQGAQQMRPQMLASGFGPRAIR